MMHATFMQLAIALGLGLLVGLQRQRADEPMAGVRTFALVTILGTVSGHLAQSYGGWILGLGCVALALQTVVSNYVANSREEGVLPGMTTEVAMLVMYAVGAYLVVGSSAVAVVVGGGVAVLLQLKEPLHRLAQRFGDEDFRLLIQFVVISMVILPVLPNREMGPYSVLNPRQIWWMVVLIVGIHQAGFLAYRLLGSRLGTVLAGLLGGLISSTATTVSYARQARQTPRTLAMASSIILIASAVVFVRVLVELAVVAPASLMRTTPPLAIMLAVMGLVAALELWRGRPQGEVLSDHNNPSQLRSAVLFGLIYAAILLAVAVVKHHLGDSALYGVAVLSGLTDMDAITLSTGQLMASSRLEVEIGWRLIALASMANLIFKWGMAWVLGGRSLAWRLALPFLGVLAVGAGLLLWWPG